MIFTHNEQELSLQFTTLNYIVFKRNLKVDNLRKALLKAAQDCDFEILAQGIRQFAPNGILKSLSDAYAVIDNASDKQELFFTFIEELGKNGFFTKKTAQELMEEIQTPTIDMQEIVNRVAPDAVKGAMMSEITRTGASI